jgi:eukaryotic-like serine/threonine-protein kinase
VDLRTQLEASLPGYTIERELGAGGMSRVFVATELSLGRRVVIKVLAPDLAAGVSIRRFEREIRLLASLQQANIVPVLASGVSDGLPYYTMPFVEGLSLRERVREGPLPIPDVIAILRDVARALAFAHEHGVVHRDIKPDNILLSGDAAVVADFGIAKAIIDAQVRDPKPQQTTVTQTGTVIGTPAYIAPEQVAADPTIDHRADLYAFGCVAYELLTGVTPFAAHGGRQMLAHLSEQARPVEEHCPDCPEGLADIVAHCLEKDPNERPQSAREILRVLEGPATSGVRLTRRARLTRRRSGLAVGAITAIAIGVFFATSGSNTSMAEPNAIAVLPFATAVNDSAAAYLGEGVADELATSLGRARGIRIVARNLSYRYAGEHFDARDIGRDLNVDYVLHGSVRRFGDRLRISTQLTRAADNSETWSESYERAADNVFSIQSEIAPAITAAVRARIGSPNDTGITATRTITDDPIAYDLYLRGRFLLQRRGPGVRQAVQRFEEAIARDSAFAHAYSALALALQLVPYFEDVRAASLRDRTVAAARRALALDSTLAEPHTALAMVHQHAYAWNASETEYQRALALDPMEADAHIQYGRFLFYTGRIAAALAEFRRARELDPYSAVASAWVGHLLQLTGREREGLAEVRRALEIDSTNPPALVMMGAIHRQRGDPEAARAYAEKLWHAMPTWRMVAASSLAALGDTARARAMVRMLEQAEERGAMHHYRLSQLYGSLGDTARMLDALERATAAHEIWPTYSSMSERQYDKVRANPRFAAIVRRVGLDPRIFTAPDGGRRP